MKKLTSVALALAMSLVTFGCTSEAPTKVDEGHQEAQQKPTEPFELNAELSGNGLTVKYPSVWSWSKGNSSTVAFIDPPCGGIITVNTYTLLNDSITPETSDSEIDAFVKEYFSGIENSTDLPATITGDYKKRIDGDAVVITAPIEFYNNSLKHVGYVYVGRIGYQMCSIMAGVPHDAGDRFINTIKDIIDNARYIKTESEQPKTSKPPTEDQTPSAPKATPSQSNAVQKARDYLDYTAFSYTGLIEQLEYEKFSTEDATYGADNCGADWNEQAAKKAQDYLDYTSFSRDGLIDQLVYEGFTYDQAVYGVDSVGL